MTSGVGQIEASRPAFKDTEQIRLGWSRGLGIIVALVGIAAAISGLGTPPSASLGLVPASGIGFTLLGVLIFVWSTRGPARSLKRTSVDVLAAGLLLWGTVSAVAAFDSDSIRPFFRRESGIGIEAVTAICFMVFGLVHLSRPAAVLRRFAVSHYALVTVFAIAYVSVLELVYGATIPHRNAHITMSGVAALLFMLASIACLLARDDDGVMKLLATRDPGGAVARRLVPLALLLVPLIDWLQARAAPAWGSSGIAIVALLYVLVLLTIIWWTGTSLHRAHLDKRSIETAIQTSEERLRMALVSAGGAVWDWDLEHDHAWWSPEMYELWGVEPQTTMRLTNSLDVVDERDREHVQQAVALAIERGSPYQSEFRVRSGPQERWMISRGRVHYDAAGKAIRLIGITVDISDRKRMELALRRSNAELERSNRELERFAHIASHDLQTPLRSIVGFAELLQGRHARHLEDEGRIWIDRIVQSAQQLHTIVHDLLQYARIDTQAQAFAPVSLQETLNHCRVLLDSRIFESAAVIESADLPTVHGDASQLTQLLLNLLDNAIKYRGKEPPHIRIGLATAEDCWTLSVADNGIGIEARHTERIFEMFERLHRLNDYSGTGVGLAICRRVVQRHGGRIWVESQPGQGSVFLFTLPRLPAREHP